MESRHCLYAGAWAYEHSLKVQCHASHAEGSAVDLATSSFIIIDVIRLHQLLTFDQGFGLEGSLESYPCS